MRVVQFTVLCNHNFALRQKEDMHWSGRSMISQREHQPRGVCANLLFGKIFAENYMKMKEIGPRGGVRPQHPS